MSIETVTYRIVNTAHQIMGPHGTRYVHDASRPWAVLRGTDHRESCVGRFSQEKYAKRLIANRRAQAAAELEAADLIG